MELRDETLPSVLAAISELPETVGVDAVDILAHWASGEGRIGGGDERFGFSSHDGMEEKYIDCGVDGGGRGGRLGRITAVRAVLVVVTGDGDDAGKQQDNPPFRYRDAYAQSISQVLSAHMCFWHRLMEFTVE